MKKYLIFGNAESVHMLKWIKELVKYYHVFLVSSKGIHPDIGHLLPKDHIRKLDLKIGTSGSNYQILKKYFEVRAIIQKVKPDFVNPHYLTSHGLLAALIKGRSVYPFKLIQSAWGTDILVTPFKNKVYYRLAKYSLDKASLVTSDSEYMTQVIRDITSTETMTFVFGLENLPEISLSEKDKNLFYSNRMLSENYNIREIISMFGSISKENPSARLVISHDGELRTQLEDYAGELGLSGKITFMGFISLAEQISLYKRAQFYISIPKSDSTSVSLLEAMAYGCIPIVSDIPSNREWISDGRNGFFYHPAGFNISVIHKALALIDPIVSTNRKLIKEKGLFPESMKMFTERLNEIAN